MDSISEYTSEEQKRSDKDADKNYKLFVAKVRELTKDSNFEDFVNFLLDTTNFNGNNYTNDNNLTMYLTARRSVFFDVMSVLEEADPTYYPRILLKRAKVIKDG
jgi:cytochrome oxidase Cu insertion factor (SCO1/SenC/PrrC family)